MRLADSKRDGVFVMEGRYRVGTEIVKAWLEPVRWVDTIEVLEGGRWRRIPWRLSPWSWLHLLRPFNWPPDPPFHVVSESPLHIVWKNVPNMGEPESAFDAPPWWGATYDRGSWRLTYLGDAPPGIELRPISRPPG